MSKRYVPFIMGLLSGGIAVALLSIGKWWSFILATLLSMFAIYSLKIAVTASDREIASLTGVDDQRDP